MRVRRNGAPVGTPTQTEVAIEPDGGTFAVPVKINDTISLKFTIDSGASYVNIPADVASTLVRSGTIAEGDFIGDQTFMLADGSTVPSALFRIRSLKIGTLDLHDVVGSIGSAKGPLLLGQSFLTRLTTWSFDNQRHVLILKTTEAGAQASPETASPARVVASAMDPASPDPVAASAQAQSPQGNDPGSAERAVMATVVDYFAAWSSPDDPDGLGVRKSFANVVNFYGSAIDLDTLVQKNTQFCRRWPLRTYTLRPAATTASCDAAQSCVVRGVLDWTAANPATGARSTGVAQFMFGFRNGLIEVEGGKVLSRG